MIQAFVWKADKQDLELVEKLVRAAFKDEEELVIFDCGYEGAPKENLEGTLLAFGVRCFNIISSSTNNKVYQLTTPKKLVDLAANKKNRVEAFEILKKIAENTVEVVDLTLTDKDVEKFLTKQLITLQKNLKEKGQEFWKGTTASGKSIAITLKPNTTVTDCEIIITFEELFAAKYAVEALGVDSLTLIGR